MAKNHSVLRIVLMLVKFYRFMQLHLCCFSEKHLLGNITRAGFQPSNNCFGRYFFLYVDWNRRHSEFFALFSFARPDKLWIKRWVIIIFFLNGLLIPGGKLH